MKEIFAIGHITQDLEPSPHLGGAVAYSAVAAQRLGMIAHIITEAPPEHPYLAELAELRVNVTRLPATNPAKELTLTTFRNFYDSAGNRQQVVSNQQDYIDLADQPNFPDIPKGSVVMVATVIGEVDPQLFRPLAQDTFLVVTPQGYFRQASDEGTISRAPWDKVQSLREAELVILSDEDLTFDASLDEAYLNDIKTLCRLVVLTRGSQGLSVYEHGKEPVEVRSFKMTPKEVISPTGAGDSCATAFTWYYLRSKNTREAAVFGGLYAALKLMGIGTDQRGVEALPTLKQVQQFAEENPLRFETYLSSNDIDSMSFLATIHNENSEA